MIEDNKLLTKQFIRFLKENNIYNQFIINYKNKYISFKSSIPTSMPTSKPTTYSEHSLFDTMKSKFNPIDCFSWSLTKEGFMFWHKKNKKWSQIYKEFIKSI